MDESYTGEIDYSGSYSIYEGGFEPGDGEIKVYTGCDYYGCPGFTAYGTYVTSIYVGASKVETA